MSLTNPNTPVSQQDLQDFYHKILPYMGGSSGGGGGHTIEDAEGTDLTQRDTMQFGTGFNATDDSENEKTVVEADVMQSGDMDDIVTPLPSIAPKKEGVKYSTTEQVVGEWIDGKPIYQKTWIGTVSSGSGSDIRYMVEENCVANHNIEEVVSLTGITKDSQITYGTTYTNSGTDQFRPLLYNVAGGTNGLTFYYGTYPSKPFKYFITMQYTKTTDTPNT